MNAPIWLIILLTIIAIPVGIVAVVYMIVPVFKATGFIIVQVARFIGGVVSDSFRLIGALITGLVLVPMIGANVLIGRWSAASHYGRTFTAELRNVGGCLYRIAIGHPTRLFCLNGLTEGIEKRLPQAIADAPTADRPGRSVRAQFEGYEIVGSLPGGGSGGKLYIAKPDAIRRASLERDGFRDVGQVVIKTFSLQDGSSLPQIVRESRALEAAKRLGLVLDHELNDQRFYYIMRYVPGDSLTLVTQRLHALSGGEGLSDGTLRDAMSYVDDLLHTLQQYHQGGLWHKDVKPDNIIVDASHTSARARAHLVDFGLVTPLRSGMTLTTHGTEYFRDPEMVRMALKGAKVHEVDGTRFDIYAAGAVLYSLIENSFPAHGGLSQITKRCPEALRWIVRRAMSDYDKRYASAGAMLADLAVLRASANPFALKPADLPSMRGMLLEDGSEGSRAEATSVSAPVQAREVPSAMPAAPAVAPAAGMPRIRVTNWWSGSYVADDGADSPVGSPAAAASSPVVRPVVRRSAAEQRHAARERVKAMQAKIRDRSRSRGGNRSANADVHRPVNTGVVLGTLITAGAVLLLANHLFKARDAASSASMEEPVLGDEPSTVLATVPENAMSVVEQTNARLNRVASAAKLRLPSGEAGGAMPRITIAGIELSPVDALSMVSRSFNGREILVIVDGQPPSATVTAAIDRLRASGFVLLGNVPGNTAKGDRLRQQLDLEADARMLRGMTTFTDHGLRDALANWLSEQRVGTTPVAGLVWFGAAAGPGAAAGVADAAGSRALVVVPNTDGGSTEAAREASFVLRTARRAVTAGK